MSARFELLAGLPATGPPATPFPSEWGRLAREGVVVEFSTESGSWVGNFEPGLGGLDTALAHPNGKDVVVIASGDLWVVDPKSREAENLFPTVDGFVEVGSPEGWIFSRGGLALFKLSPAGVVWHTRRLSWDGIEGLEIRDGFAVGKAYSPMDDQWHAFSVDVRTGRAEGGSFWLDAPDAWEQLREP